MENKTEKNNSLFIVILFAVVLVLVLFMPKIYEFIETEKLPEVENKEEKEEIKETTVDEETLENIQFPIMRNSIYDINTYYSLDKFTISNMSNNDILYNAFMDIEEVVITESDVFGSCTSTPRQFGVDYLELRIKNILGRNVNYILDSFYVPEDSNSNYKGTWIYDSNYNRYIYQGLCSYKATNTKYYNLEELIKAEYDNNDIVVYYYVGFAKVVDNNYVIYSDANMTNEINVSGMCVNGLFSAGDWKSTTKEIIVPTEEGLYNILFYWNNMSNNEGFSAVIDDILIEALALAVIKICCANEIISSSEITCRTISAVLPLRSSLLIFILFLHYNSMHRLSRYTYYTMKIYAFQDNRRYF